MSQGFEAGLWVGRAVRDGGPITEAMIERAAKTIDAGINRTGHADWRVYIPIAREALRQALLDPSSRTEKT